MSDKNDVVMIKLDRIRELRFGHKALKMLGSLTGKDIDALTIAGEIDPENIELFMFCGLQSDAKANGETLRMEDMEDLLDEGTFMDTVEKLSQAINLAFGSSSLPKETVTPNTTGKPKRTTIK